MFESLTEKLENAIGKIKGYGTITEENRGGDDFL